MKAKEPFLLVDLGNTRIKWATARGETPPRRAGEAPTSKISTAWIVNLARKHRRERMVLASVVPRWIPAFKRAFAGRIDVVNGGVPIPGLAYDYPRPAELGADRIAAAAAAPAFCPLPVIIVACGTATAYTVLDGRGRITGGAIAPGVQAQLDALSGAAAQLPAADLRAPRGVIGKSTVDAIRLGVLASFRGGVRETVGRLSLGFAEPPHVLVTGGNARHLGRDPGFAYTLRPLLVLEGLHMIALRRLAPQDS